MSAEILRRAAAAMRERAEAVDGWYSAAAWATTHPFSLPIEPADAEHIASWHPAVALAVADWLDATAERHHPSESPVELYLHTDESCAVCDEGGHECVVCDGCWPSWDGMDAHTVYPCHEAKAALAVARAYLKEDA